MTNQRKVLWLRGEENSHSPKHKPQLELGKGGKRSNVIRIFKYLTLPAFRIQDGVLTRQPSQRWDLNAEDYSHQIAYRAMPAKVKNVQNLCRISKESYQKFSKMCSVSMDSRISTES